MVVGAILMATARLVKLMAGAPNLQIKCAAVVRIKSSRSSSFGERERRDGWGR
jgi:hypothetical protein